MKETNNKYTLFIIITLYIAVKIYYSDKYGRYPS